MQGERQVEMEDTIKKLHKTGQSDIDISSELHKIISMLYHGIAKVDLNQHSAVVLKSRRSQEIGNQYNWEEYLQFYVNQYLLPSDRKRAFGDFCTENLLKYNAQGKHSLIGDFSSYLKDTNKEHVTMLAFITSGKSSTPYAYVLVRNTGHRDLLNSIIEQYVYDACDYFIYLDARHNSYTMFSGQNWTLLPPKICTDYEKEVVDYALAYVVEEDREMVIREMTLSRVIEQLDKYGKHSFTCGMIESNGKYARKHVDYRYHNKEEQTILLSRTDITDVYLEEARKRKELEETLVRAQTDLLTKLLNFQTTMDRITECLVNTNDSYALFFIDIDNFKRINDTFGHPAGDRILREIADGLAGIAGESDIVGRVGGDEFVFFSRLDRLQEQAQAEHTAQMICDAIKSIQLTETSGETVTGSVGIALAPLDGLDYYTLVTKADQGVYHTKKTGKNNYSFG